MNESNFNLQNQAYNKILHKIIHCEYIPGQRIVQKKLEDELQIGRTPIREALLRLQREGLIYTVPQSGTYVTKIDLDAANDARFIRENIEKVIVAEAAALESSLLFEQAHDAITLQEKYIANGDFNLFFDEDETFHKSFYLATNHAQIWAWLQTINIQFNRFRWLRLRVTELPWNIQIEQHREILEAVEAHDSASASARSEKHLHLVFAEESTVIKSYPDYFENLPTDFLKN